jgi:5-formaminoimidazole-4-carboxamide-1-beta-D-ribofuranosyl 5'-monophosphate synthetase
MVQISKAKKKKSWFIKDKKQKIREEVNKLLSVSFIR